MPPPLSSSSSNPRCHPPRDCPDCFFACNRRNADVRRHQACARSAVFHGLKGMRHCRDRPSGPTFSSLRSLNRMPARGASKRSLSSSDTGRGEGGHSMRRRHLTFNMSIRPNWSRALPRPLLIPDVMTLNTLDDVRTFMRHLPEDRLQRQMWRHAALQLKQAAADGVTTKVAVSLRMVLSMEGVECRPL
jgi:hypothetical protein